MRVFQIDILKAYCAFFVVCIHTIPANHTVGGYIVALCRCAVPIFFIISGYFSSDYISDKKRLKNRIGKIFYLFLYSNILYFVWNLVSSMIKNLPIIYFFGENFTFKNIVNFVLFNDNMFSGHLWYLEAILYVFLIVYFLKEKMKKLYFLIPILLLIDLIFGKYSLLFFRTEFPYIYMRNFLFVGLPYFMIGLLIKDLKNNRIINKKPSKLCLLSIIFINIFERCILLQNDLNATRDHYFSTTLLSIALFLYFLNVDSEKCKINTVLKKIGRDYSTYIYIYHPIFISICSFLFHRFLHFNNIYVIIQPFIVYLFTLMFLIIWKRIKLVINRIFVKV